jgi:hypothetical protein
VSARWEYPLGATQAERELLDQRAAEHGQDERDGNHEEYR